MDGGVGHDVTRKQRTNNRDQTFARYVAEFFSQQDCAPVHDIVKNRQRGVRLTFLAAGEGNIAGYQLLSRIENLCSIAQDHA